MSELTKQALKVENNQSFPNNNAGLITPSALRTFNENMIDSLVDEIAYTADSASFNSRINNVTGSATNTGSLLTTASFDNNTRNLTFTKGDSSTFAVNIPDASGSILPSGVVSGSSQIDYPFISNIPSGIVSGSSQVSYTGLSNIPSGIVSGAAQVTPLLPSGVVSGSSQVSYTGLSNIPAGIVSGSSQIILQDTTGLLSGSRIDGAVTSSLTSSLANQALDVVVNVKNSTGTQINKGTIVRIIGATGDNPLIQTASWENDGSSANTLGWVLADIPNGDFGKVVTQGTLLGVNTDPALGYTAGQVLYLSSSGQYTNVIPPAPYHEVRLGQVLRAQQNNGSVFVLIQNGYELGELHDVNINTSSLANNNVLAYNSTSGQWINQTPSGLGVAMTGSNNTFSGTQTFNNIVVNGTASIAYTQTVTGSAKIIGDAFIILNNDTPTERYAGIIVLDSGSAGTSASFQFDGLTNDWFYEYTGSDPLNFGVVMFGPEYGTKGSPTYLTNNRLPKGDGGHHLNDSNISDDGSNVSINSNTQITGSLLINGNAPLINSDLTSLNNFTQSQQSVNTNLNAFTSSASDRLNNIELTTASLQVEVDNLQSVTGSYATTGSNTFTGDQTLIDAAGNTITLSDASGSLMLVAKTFTSASTHLTASAGNQVNIIFKNNNNTTDTTISGSNNIFTNPSAPTADYKRIIGSNNIVNSATGIPQVSGSMTTPITMASNYFGSGTTTVRGPITGSLFTISNNAIFGTLNLGQAGVNDLTRVSAFTFTGNQVIGTMTFGASTSATLPNIVTTPSITNNIVNGALQATMNSSSLFFSTNIVNAGSFIINNNHFTTAGGAGNLSVANNLVGGTQISNLTVQGANQGGTTNNPAFNGNLIYGLTNATHINADNARISGTNAYTALNATAILGGNLAVTGSSLGSDTATVGSAFVGRFNANDGIRNKTSDIVFAVGTGTATGTRKTGLLVDSGSNTFVEGSLNVSGSSVFTGSLILSSSAAVELQVIGETQFTGSVDISGSLTASLQEGHIFVGDGSGRTTTIATSSLSSVPFPYTGSAQVTGSLGITGSMSGFVNTLSVASSTASVNFSDGNMFVITLTGGATTHFTPSNIKAGQTINIQISQPSGASTGSVSFSPNVLFAGGNDYQVTATGSAIDLLTFVSLDGTNVLGTSIKNFL